eukprot:886823-Pyramimonas_sp.AAC.1
MRGARLLARARASGQTRRGCAPRLRGRAGGSWRRASTGLLTRRYTARACQRSSWERNGTSVCVNFELRWADPDSA